MISESEVGRSQTDFFINEDPTDLVLRRKDTIPDGAGGTKIVPRDLSPQRVRIVGSVNPNPVITPDGRTISIQKSIVGFHELDVLEGDEFDIDDKTYEVISVQPDPSWRMVAGAVRRVR